jgi:hypothetical protein
MKNSAWLAGLAAVVAVLATGCAGGPEALVMGTDGVLIEPVGGGLVTLSADRALPVAGASQSVAAAVAVDDATAAIAASPSCPVAEASAISMATALPLAGCVRGSLLPSDAGRYFVLQPQAGVSYLISVTHAVDARFDLGRLITAADGSTDCAPLATGLVATRVTVDGRPGRLCVVVRSASGEAQSFRLITEE